MGGKGRVGEKGDGRTREGRVGSAPKLKFGPPELFSWS